MSEQDRILTLTKIQGKSEDNTNQKPELEWQSIEQRGE
jgi:hypothetical protein